MKKLLLAAGIAAAFLSWSASQADAQQMICYKGAQNGNCVPVAPSGSAWGAPLPVTGSFSAAGFTPNGNFGTLTATGSSSASTALPAGATVAFQNTGTTTVSCVLATGSATATTNKLLVPGNSTVFQTVGSNVNTACIDQTGSTSTVVVLAGGSGLGTNFGGGGSSSGGGGLSVTDNTAFTANTSTFTPSGCEYNATPNTMTSGNQAMVGCSQYRAFFMDVIADATKSTLYNILTSAVPVNVGSTATAVNGKTVGGTTGMDIDVNSIGGTAIDTNSGNKSAGTQRNVLATDQPALATWGHGATGAAAPSGATQAGFIQSGATGGFLKGQISCDTHGFVHITSATDTLLVQGVASQTVYVCAATYSFSGSAAQSVYLENTASTNANCSSTKTQIAGLVTGNSSAPLSTGFYNALWGGLKNTSGNGLCANSSGSGGVDLDFWYAQF
jgi:hypothetical protein